MFFLCLSFVRLVDQRTSASILSQINCCIIFSTMSTATAKLLSEVEALPVEEKEEFLREITNHLPPWDSGHLAMTSLLPVML
jgi:hypothetical protein